METIAALSAAEWAPRILERLAEPAPLLAFAYFIYGTAHTVIDLLAKEEHKVWLRVRSLCHILLGIVLFTISVLYALEYLAADIISV